MAAPSCPAAPVYEIVPSGTLPVLDLSRSVGGELWALVKRVVRWCPSGRVTIDSTTSHSSGRLARMLRGTETPSERDWLYRTAVSASLAGSVLGSLACVVPARAGAVCAALGLALVLPFSVLSFLLLRFDMLKLLLTTYDVWFYSLVNTIGAVLLSVGFADARACVAVIVWLGNIHTVLVDANTRFVCHLNIVSVGAVVVNVVVMIAMETNAIDAWRVRTLRFRDKHASDTLETDNLISNALTTMTIIVVRNVYRRHTELLQQMRISCPMLRCINYRCRVRVQAADAARLAEIRAFSEKQRIYYPPECSASFPRSQMHYLRFQRVLDASETLFPVALEPIVWSPLKRMGFVALGVAGLALTAATFGLFPSPLVQPVAIAGLCTTMLFMGFAVALYHRPGTRSIVFSFDFVFLSLQLSLGFGSAGLLFGWDARAVALASMWLWLHWALTIDAWTPLMRRKVGVPTKLLIVPVWLLFVAAQLCVAVELLWRDRWAFTDRVVVSLFGRVDVRLLPFFLSRLVMMFLWSLRLLWRAATSREGDAIVQIGRVGFMYTDTVSQPSRAITAATKAAKAVLQSRRKAATKSQPTAAQISPVTTFIPE